MEIDGYVYSHPQGKFVRFVVKGDGWQRSITQSTGLLDESFEQAGLVNSLACTAESINHAIQNERFEHEEEVQALRQQIKNQGAEWRRMWGDARRQAREMQWQHLSDAIGGDKCRSIGLSDYDESGGCPYRYLYLLMDGGEVVYVGQASNIKSRISQHRRDAHKDFDRVKYKMIASADIDQAEVDAIKLFAPVYNISHNAGFAYKRMGDSSAVLRAREYRDRIAATQGEG